MPTDPLKKVCPRCRGKGVLQGMRVVHRGFPGTCFKCDGSGEVYKDPFHTAFGVGQKFFGITRRLWLNPNNPNNGVTKMIGTPKDYAESGGVPPSGLTHWGNYSWVEITEEQARAFYKKYGRDTKVPGETTVEDSASEDWRRMMAKRQAQT